MELNFLLSFLFNKFQKIKFIQIHRVISLTIHKPHRISSKKDRLKLKRRFMIIRKKDIN